MRKVKWLGLVFMVVIGLGVGYFYYNRRVSHFVCTPDCDQSINQALAALDKTKVRLVPQAVSELLKSHSEIGNFTISERGWGNLELKLEAKKPLFSVKRGGWYYHYDWNGRFVEKSTDKIFPTLEARDFNDDVVKGLRILFFFAKLESTYTAQIVDDSLLVSTPEIIVKFPLENDYQLLITKYYYIRNNMLPEVKKNLVVNNQTPITMDLRYLRPIAYKNE